MIDTSPASSNPDISVSFNSPGANLLFLFKSSYNLYISLSKELSLVRYLYLNSFNSATFISLFGLNIPIKLYTLFIAFKKANMSP